jgi:hypothetical protein
MGLARMTADEVDPGSLFAGCERSFSSAMSIGWFTAER